MPDNYAVLTAGAGLLLKIGGRKILIDPLHNEKTPQFSSVPEAIQRRIMDGEGDFADIDYMIITHGHPDHVSPMLVNRYLKLHPDVNVLTPVSSIHGENVHYLMLPSESYKFGDDHFYFRRTLHDGMEFKNVINYSGIINIGGKNISFFGDMTIDKSLISGEFKETHFDISIFNFPFLTIARGREIMKMMAPDEMIICHLPFEYDDINGYNSVTMHAAEKNMYTLPPMHIMREEMQKEYLMD